MGPLVRVYANPASSWDLVYICCTCGSQCLQIPLLPPALSHLLTLLVCAAQRKIYVITLLQLSSTVFNVINLIGWQ